MYTNKIKVVISCLIKVRHFFTLILLMAASRAASQGAPQSPIPVPRTQRHRSYLQQHHRKLLPGH